MEITDEWRDALSDLVQVNAQFIQAVRRLAREGGSAESLASWRTLGVLQRSGPVRLGLLADASRVAQPTMTKLVAGLVERGVAERLPDPDDARAWLIGITESGRSELAAWRAELASGLAPYFTELDAADIDALRHTVRLLQTRLAQIGPGVADKNTNLEGQE